MSNQQQQEETVEEEQSEMMTDDESQEIETTNPSGGRKPSNVNSPAGEGTMQKARRQQPERRIVPVHESRIKDRPVKEGQGASDSSLKIKIELDLEVEVELYARVKGDVTIGLM
ncbi:MAG: hypothetical protein M4579_005674 [Chaenotheca gracillima]|nr:MAG: hypothetical protein M4579_005674 [Chaenotheca gracillima]